MNVHSLLSNSASKFPERIAIIDGETRLTFGMLEERSNRLANALKVSGLKKGDRAALLFHNSAWFVEVYFGALKAGLVPAPINFRLTGREIVYILNHSSAKALFYGTEFEETILKIRDQLDNTHLFVSPHYGASPLAVEYERFLSNADKKPDVENVSEEDICQLMYTSGTTGRPKGILLTHRNVIWNLFNTVYGREDTAGQISIIVGPLYHTAALNNHLTIQISLGGASVLIRKFDPLFLLETIQRKQASLISGAPAMYNLLLQHPDAGKFDVNSITKCTAGADKLPSEIRRRLMDFFPNIKGVYDVYGLTEASPCVTILSAEDSNRKEGSVGKALPFLQAKTVNRVGGETAPGEVGEIICRGPNVMKGYHRDPEATRETIQSGWLHTGDLALVDEEGFFFVVDRKKDMIVSGGENIYPREVEEVLITHPAVADVAVIGIPDRDWGESVMAYITPRKGHTISEQEIITFCKDHLASYKKPKKIAFLSAIPRTPSGKALKRTLRKKSEGGQGAAPE